MDLPPDYKPEFESLKDLLLEMGEERSLDSLLRHIVRRLAERPHIALARVWLRQPGDICPTCPLRAECPDRTTCLHLVASAGNPTASPGADWSRLSGDFRRVPIGARKVGLVASRADAVVVKDARVDAKWIARPEWAAREGIRGFGGQPLLFKGEVLGVIAVFTRIPLVLEGLPWLRLIADHAAIAIANARAFEEIESLRRRLEDENAYLREEVAQANAFGSLIGQSPALRNVVEQIELVAPTDAGVLILGESGTGKELVAREIHTRSRRREHPLIKVNCASVPPELYESEFFGHVKGSFTGAVRDRTGRFELANGGTLFLDEVGEIPLSLQGKLLRVLQEGQYERVGDESTRQVDVRILAATNRDLRREVERGRFREDLYYRLNVFPIEIVPLRERKEDIPLLADHFLDLAARRLGVRRSRLTEANVVQLHRYDWPGNVRELQNVVERAVIFSRGGALSFSLPSETGRPVLRMDDAPEPPGARSIVVEEEWNRRARENLLAALRRADWRIYGPAGAAELLGIKPTTLASRMKKWGVRKEGERGTRSAP